MGSILKNGGRFYVDLIGIGGDIVSDTLLFSVKTLGFQFTASNGFYWGIRSYVIIFNGNTGTSSFIRTTLNAYLTLGCDFGKKIKPKNYEPR